MLSGQFPDVLVITITFVMSGNKGWTDSRLRTSIRRPQTCDLDLTDYNWIPMLAKQHPITSQSRSGKVSGLLLESAGCFWKNIESTKVKFQSAPDAMVSFFAGDVLKMQKFHAST